MAIAADSCVTHITCDLHYKFRFPIAKPDLCIVNQTMVLFLWGIENGEKLKQEDCFLSLNFL